MRTAICCLSATLALVGCRDPDAVTRAELRAGNQHLSAELERAYAQAAQIRDQRDGSVEEALRLREQIEGLQIQLGRGRLAPPMVAGPLLATDPERGSLVLDGLAFRPGSAELTPEGEAAIASLAAALSRGDLAGASVIAIGHTDDQPVRRPITVDRFGDNWGLSAMRAAAVVGALQRAGVDAKRLRGAFRGPHEPRSSERAANRRVELYLVEPLGD